MPKSALGQSVVFLGGLRTPITHPYQGLKNFSAVQLACAVIKNIIERNKINKSSVDEVVLGNVVAAGIGQNLARQAALTAGLPATVPAFTVNNVCGAGLQAVVLAAQSILAQRSHLILAGGTESATQTPYLVKRQEVESNTLKTTELNLLDSLKYDGLLCQITGRRMGELAEKLAQEFHISQKEQDDYAFESHRKACAAQKEGKFKSEILSLLVNGKTISQDEHPRKNLERVWLDKLSPAFGSTGTVTAANSSLACDGAAVVAVASAQFVKKYKRKPLARLIGYSSIAVKPEDVFESTHVAIAACLKECGLRVGDIDFFEISEAFAAQVVLTEKKLKISRERINLFGGDLALGHPLGAAGARILVTLLNVLEDQKKKRGLACVSFGGGGAMAMIIERDF